MMHSVLTHRRKHHRILVDPPAGPLGVWHLEENSGDFADSTANGNTLTRNGTIIRISGHQNYGQRFAPSPSGYASRAYGVDIDLSGAFTLAFWIKPDIYGDGHPMYPVIVDPASGIYFRIVVGAYTNIILRDKYWEFFNSHVGQSQFASGIWTHMILTRWSDTAAPVLYLNGLSMILHNQGSGLTWNTPITFKVGATTYDAYGMDECIFWGRGFSQAQAVDLFNNGIP